MLAVMAAIFSLAVPDRKLPHHVLKHIRSYNLTPLRSVVVLCAFVCLCVPLCPFVCLFHAPVCVCVCVAANNSLQLARAGSRVKTADAVTSRSIVTMVTLPPFALVFQAT